MPLIRPGALLLATAISGPAIYHAVVVGDLDGSTAMIRFLIAVPVAMLMLAGLRSVTASYRRHVIETADVRAEDKALDEP